MRQLEPNEKQMLCRFGCKTIVDKALRSCEMCCEQAIAERVLRVTPIHEASKEQTAKATEARNRLLEDRREMLEFAALDKATAPTEPKSRKARS